MISNAQWLKSSPEEVKEHIYKLAKKGLTPSQIGTRVAFVGWDISVLTVLCHSHNRCYSEGQSWRGTSQAHHGKQNSEDSEG